MMSSVVPSFLALALSLVPLLLALVVGANTIAMTGARDSRQTFQKVVTCYYSNWAYWRSGNGKYTVDDIDVSVCTHLVYAFAVLDANTHKMIAYDSWLDLPSGLDNYRKFTSLKQRNAGLKTLLGLGGWTDSRGSYKYSDLVASPTLRSTFITHAIDFLEEYNFDGLDLDWEYPAYSDGGRPADKTNFAIFVQELKEALGPRNLLLTSAVAAVKQVIDAGYDIPKLAIYLDYIHLMTYDFHGSWETRADHHSPLHKRDFDTTDLYAEFAASYWIANGASANKLVLGIPLYGRSFTLSSGQKAPPAPASGPGNAGSITQEAGILSYMEICSALPNGYTQVKDNTGKMGPYAYKQSQWVGYDDPEMMARKAEFIWQRGLAGGMVWALDLDDFRNTCGGGTYPLMKRLSSELENQSPTATTTTTTTTSTTDPTTPPTTMSSMCPTTIVISTCLESVTTTTTIPPTTVTTTTTIPPTTDTTTTTIPPTTITTTTTNPPTTVTTTTTIPPTTITTTTTIPPTTVTTTTTIPPTTVTTTTTIPPTTVTTTTTIPPTTICYNSFKCQGDGLWADPCDCSKFYNCFGGKPNHTKCPTGTLWNDDKKTWIPIMARDCTLHHKPGK